MGIRIHKVLGYGFKYCKFDKDPRFNDWVFNAKSEKFYENKKDEFLEFLKDKKSKFSKEERIISNITMDINWIEGTGWFDKEKPVKSLSLSDFIKYNYFETEGKNPIGPVIFTLPSSKDWNRYDDIIDYVECSIDNKGSFDSVKFYKDDAGQPAEIYPYVGFVNRNTGKRVRFSQSDRWILTDILQKSKKVKNPSLKHIDPDLETNFQKEGITNLIEWQRWIVPIIPDLIVNFCEFAKVFKNPLTIYRLKPMIYTYWC